MYKCGSALTQQVRSAWVCMHGASFKATGNRPQVRSVNSDHRKTRRAHTDVSRATPFPDRRILKPTQYHTSKENVRKQSSLKLDETPTNPLAVLHEDMQKVHQHSAKVLRDYITSEEMFNIATYYYNSQLGSLVIWSSLPLIISKCLNYHMHKEDALTKNQMTITSAIDLSFVAYLLHDDVADNSKTRFKLPAANVMWYPYKVITAGNVVYALTVSMATQLSNSVTVSLCQMHESQYRGQYFSEEKRVGGRADPFDHYLAATDGKAGSMGYHLGKAVAHATGASDFLVDVVARMMFHTGTFLQLVDDLKDLEEDLRDGLPTAAVLFAANKYPVIGEMQKRDFKGEGDVDTALELVNKSEGKLETRQLAMRHFNFAMEYLKMMAKSPGRDTFEALAKYQLERKINYHN